ncbi:MAG: toxic anion resistance protein [Clostridiales bacterium]|nr:toxic anion resistance protein [Clostridiales bacterium]
MAIDFEKASVAGANTPAEEQGEIIEVKEYDIVEDRKKVSMELTNSAELDMLTSKIDLANLDTIVSFGADVTEEISKASDVVLNSMSISKVEESSKMLNELSAIMSKFDIEEIKENPGFFNKLFANAKKQLEKILAKYQTMGGEVDKIYIQLKQYEDEIKKSNKMLNSMFEANVDYYHELVKYIVAGEQGCKEIAEYRDQKQKELEAGGDNSLQFEITALDNALMMLEQRTQDLRTAEAVAMQSIPMIKTMEFSNLNLIRKINSAFIITLPVFKQALAQAILLKRQKLQAEAMAVLDEKTNEMLIKNAQNTAQQSKMTAALVSESSIKIETLEKSWKTIVDGIEETKQIQERARQKRIEDEQKLKAMKDDFNTRYSLPNGK